MSSRTRKLAAVIGAATVASTAAFAIGTQVNGQAVAGGLMSGGGESRSGDRGHRGPDVSALATKLGVSTERLQAALEKTRPARPHGDRRGGDKAAALAKELGISADKVEAAFASLPRPERGSRPGGPGPGMGFGGPGGERALTGDTAAKVKRAALARVSGGTVVRAETDAGGVYEAHVRRSDGTEVEVKVDRQFKVTAVEQHDRG